MPALVRIALACLALVMLTVGSLATAQTERPAPAPTAPGGIGGQPGDDDDDGPSPRAGAREERGTGEFGTGYPFGQSRRIDPFEAEAEAQRVAASKQPAAADPDHVIVCVAGCDGPSGQVVARGSR